MKSYALIALLLVSGCAYSPKETMEQGERSVHQLQLPPEGATLCMVRNIENSRPALAPTYRPLDGGGQELLIRSSGVAFVPIMARVVPQGTGSEVTVWLTPNPILGKTGLTEIMIAGC